MAEPVIKAVDRDPDRPSNGGRLVRYLEGHAQAEAIGCFL